MPLLRVLIPTNRHIYRTVSYGMVVDFEDTVASLTDADIVPVDLPSRRARLRSLKAGRFLSRVDPPRDRYDVCFFVAMEPQWVPTLRHIRQLREVAKTVVVYLFDSWTRHLDLIGKHRGVWTNVDHLFVSFRHAVGRYQDAMDCEVHYLPQAVDGRWFHTTKDERPIHLVSIGRRHQAAHEQLLDLARRENLFYYYQTIRAPEAIDFRENQELVGRLLRSSRVHVGWSVESTDPQRAEGGGPITARWFESAATGGRIIGRAPENDEFDVLFPDAGFVRELDPRSPGDARRVVMEALANDDHARRMKLAAHVLTNHTWEARWRQIVEQAKLTPAT